MNSINSSTYKLETEKVELLKQIMGENARRDAEITELKAEIAITKILKQKSQDILFQRKKAINVSSNILRNRLSEFNFILDKNNRQKQNGIPGLKTIQE
ncbi:hypothetical protein C1645_578207 [Glomus cerebriforme]|uniref:Uncharacterized protein n=1 Tax=Glomus cerebriforme TaxID=658196 RepID=A0A397T8N3_9GLOM|nr:hypothetical protein C1645_578207 [Glomus cerebriforme]